MIMIEHIQMMTIPYLDILSILLSGQVPLGAIQVTCFEISRNKEQVKNKDREACHTTIFTTYIRKHFKSTV